MRESLAINTALFYRALLSLCLYGWGSRYFRYFLYLSVFCGVAAGAVRLFG